MGDEEVTLRDGSAVLIRPVQPEDKELFLAGWERFGEESRYRRFMGAKGGLSPRDLAYFTEVDHVDHEAIGARDAETGEGVGVARYVRLPNQPTVAEAAVAVVDDWQRRGLGGELLRRLTERARANGIERFHASLFAVNHAMLALFEDLGELEVQHVGEGRIEIDVELPCEPRRSSAPRCAPRPRASCACDPEPMDRLTRRELVLGAGALALGAGAADALGMPARDPGRRAGRRAARAAPGRARCASSHGACAGP